MGEPLTGHTATLYLGAWARTAEPGHRGLNADRVRRDALERSRAALGRLRAAALAPLVRVARVFRPRRTTTARTSPLRQVRGSRRATEPPRRRRSAP